MTTVRSDPECFIELAPLWDPLVPESERLGPFPLSGWARLWWEHLGRADARELRVAPVAEGEELRAVLPLYVDREAGEEPVLLFLGGTDVTDYTVPAVRPDALGTTASVAIELVMADGAGLHCVSAPDDIGWGDALVEAAGSAGLDVSVSAAVPAPYIDLPSDMDTYVGSLDSKERHELRRKIRRFERELGQATLRRADQATIEADLGLFFGWHRQAPGEKALFMSPEREAFFRGLAAEMLSSGVLALDILEGAGAPIAAGFSFVMGDTIYLYNSSLSADAYRWSPGMVLLACMIERSMADGLHRLDFLKGDERYKYQLGGVARTISDIVVRARR